jgi:CheY-like chemotaxis protein/HPt (histidine-containing phosphotransfer) domain-containing protein
VANNGREAVAAVSAQDFDVVLMDVQMPDMDGLQATMAIRHAEEGTGKHTTIVAMTAHAMKGDKERCLESGMDSYVSKPVRAPVLHQALKEISDKRGGIAMPADQPAEPSAMPPACRLNWPEAMESVGDDVELLREVMDALLQETKQMVENLPQCIASGNSQETRRLAHTIKGAFRMLCPCEAHDLAERLEFLAKDGNLDEAMPAFEALKTELGRAMPEIAAFVKGELKMENS